MSQTKVKSLDEMNLMELQQEYNKAYTEKNFAVTAKIFEHVKEKYSK